MTGLDERKAGYKGYRGCIVTWLHGKRVNWAGGLIELIGLIRLIGCDCFHVGRVVARLADRPVLALANCSHNDPLYTDKVSNFSRRRTRNRFGRRLLQRIDTVKLMSILVYFTRSKCRKNFNAEGRREADRGEEN